MGETQSDPSSCTIALTFDPTNFTGTLFLVTPLAFCLHLGAPPQMGSLLFWSFSHFSKLDCLLNQQHSNPLSLSAITMSRRRIDFLHVANIPSGYDETGSNPQNIRLKYSCGTFFPQYDMHVSFSDYHECEHWDILVRRIKSKIAYFNRVVPSNLSDPGAIQRL